jgi:uncharacterized protein (TIGR02594 family)
MTIKKWYINQDNSNDVRGIDESNREVVFIDTSHSIAILVEKTKQYPDAPYYVMPLNPIPPVVQNQKPSYAQLLIKEASKWVGVHEKGGNNKGAEVELFQKAVDGKASGEAWCMAFMQFCIKQVEASEGINSKIFRSEHCMTVWNNSPEAIKTHTPEVGCIIIWRHGQTSNGHTGIITGIDVDGDFLTIEGNTADSSSIIRDGDGVFSRVRSKNGSGEMKIVGFIKPF